MTTTMTTMNKLHRLEVWREEAPLPMSFTVIERGSFSASFLLSLLVVEKVVRKACWLTTTMCELQ
jgi:hypothetical protein